MCAHFIFVDVDFIKNTFVRYLLFLLGAATQKHHTQYDFDKQQSFVVFCRFVCIMQLLLIYYSATVCSSIVVHCRIQIVLHSIQCKKNGPHLDQTVFPFIQYNNLSEPQAQCEFRFFQCFFFFICLHLLCQTNCKLKCTVVAIKSMTAKSMKFNFFTDKKKLSGKSEISAIFPLI